MRIYRYAVYGLVIAYALYRILDWTSYGKMSRGESAFHVVALTMMIGGAVGALYCRRKVDLCRRRLADREELRGEPKPAASRSHLEVGKRCALSEAALAVQKMRPQPDLEVSPPPGMFFLDQEQQTRLQGWYAAREQAVRVIAGMDESLSAMLLRSDAENAASSARHEEMMAGFQREQEAEARRPSEAS